MAALPYMQFYVAEYLADTSHLNAAQHGAYLLLLMNYWQRGKPIPDANDRLAIVARMSPEEWASNRGVVAEFFIVKNDLWMHGRVERDLLKVKGISLAGKIGGMASAKARKEKASNDRSKTVERIGNQQNRTEQIKTEKTKTTTPQSGFELPSWIDPETWTTYLEVRASKRAAKTPRAWSAVVKELLKFKTAGHDPNAILETSIRANWADVYEPKPNGGSNGHENQYEAARRRIREEAMAEGEADDFS